MFAARSISTSSAVVLLALVGAASGQVPSCPNPFVSINPLENDMDIAVGRTHIVTVEQDRISVHDKCGNPLSIFPQLIDGPSGFFTQPPLDRLIDPEAAYDPDTKRFFVMAHSNFDAGYTTDYVYFGASAVENATLWTKTEITVPYVDQAYNLDSGNFAVKGSDVWFNGLITINDLQCPIYSYVIAKINKAALINGTTLAVTWLRVCEFDFGSAALCENLSHDAMPQYAILADTPSDQTTPMTTLRLYALKEQAGAIVTSSFGLTLPTPYYRGPDTVSQPSPGIPIDIASVGMSRIWNAVYRDGSIWAVHTAATVPNGPAVIRWYQIKLNGWQRSANDPSPTLEQHGAITPDPLGYLTEAFVPAVAVDAAGNAAVSYMDCGPNRKLTIARSYRCFYDSPNTMRPTFGLVTSPAVPTSGLDSGGDYTGLANDPAVVNRWWTHAWNAVSPT
jgi:hypothetical protein